MIRGTVSQAKGEIDVTTRYEWDKWSGGQDMIHPPAPIPFHCLRHAIIIKRKLAFFPGMEMAEKVNEPKDRTSSKACHTSG